MSTLKNQYEAYVNGTSNPFHLKPGLSFEDWGKVVVQFLENNIPKFNEDTMEVTKELIVSEKINGVGDNLYVLVKRDTDNYCGLWYANDENHLREQYLGSTGSDTQNYWDEHHPVLIGELVDFKN